MREIVDILKEINEKINIDNVRFYELADLQTKDGKTFPLVNKGAGQGTKISFEDTLQVYHRKLDSQTETDSNLGKGKFPYQKRVYSMRLVGVGNMRSFPNDYDINDKIKNQIYDQIPTVLSDKEIIIVGDENSNRNEVISDEYPGFDFNKLNLDTLAFYIEYEISQRICPTRN